MTITDIGNAQLIQDDAMSKLERKEIMQLLYVSKELTVT